MEQRQVILGLAGLTYCKVESIAKFQLAADLSAEDDCRLEDRSDRTDSRNLREMVSA